MRRTVRFFLWAILLFCLLFPAGMALAATKVQIVEYQCRVCDKIFYGFKGDKLDDDIFMKQDVQLARMSKLSDRGKPLDPCKGGMKSHILDKKREGEATMEFISQNLDKFVVLKGSGSVHGTLKEWECFMCKKPFYSLNKEDLNIKEWDEQQNYLFSLKGKKPISRCKEGYQGHVFMPKKEGSFSSSELAIVVYDLFWSK
ncbi:hypothetical protein [Fretibacterium fastidiosum]|uniref:Uncharacterized protein n=1 Tax=Fretibacterium fastidiosum TaxID=651822 RepID=A0AB94IWL1_9BACT|nr:hypothetical protein [Fretibacterium fastidiosum]CBL28084.1 hypothetical protein SY1_07540 [Fretibacterium fastidiosum]